MQPLLVFHNHLEQSDDLIVGRLILIDKSTNKLADEFMASSGLCSWQTAKDVDVVGKGTIPKQIDVGIVCYQVDTLPINEPSYPGILGNFYPITPGMVTINGTGRGEFGVHNNPSRHGTSGCIGLQSEVGWTAFQKWMLKLHGDGVKTVPLLISYSK